MVIFPTLYKIIGNQKHKVRICVKGNRVIIKDGFENERFITKIQLICDNIFDKYFGKSEENNDVKTLRTAIDTFNKYVNDGYLLVKKEDQNVKTSNV